MKDEILEVKDVPLQHRPVVVSINNDTTHIADAIDDLRDAMMDRDCDYFPVNTAHWASPPPTTLPGAVDRVAAWIAAQGGKLP